MNRKQSQIFRLDVSVKLGTFLLDEDQLDKVQQILQEYAPKWAAGLHIWRYRQKKTPIDTSIPGSLAVAVRNRATERGPLFYELERRFGTKNLPRVFGSAELRGATDSLVLIVNLDEEVFLRIGNKWLLGNSLAFQICRTKVDGIDSVTWSSRVFEALCTALSPIHAHAEMIEEYDAKNISHEGGGTIAIGTDISKALSGLYWLNFLGKPYKDLIGHERLLTAPAFEVKEIDNGILIALSNDPKLWTSAAYRDVERRVLTHLSSAYFFDRENQDRKTVAPDFHLTV